MSRVDEHKKSRMGRPPVDSESLRARVERSVLDALDAYAAAQPEALTRPQAVKSILSDWLATHGFLQAPHDHDIREDLERNIAELEHKLAALGEKPSPQRALHQMKAAIARNDHRRLKGKSS